MSKWKQILPGRFECNVCGAHMLSRAVEPSTDCSVCGSKETIYQISLVKSGGIWCDVNAGAYEAFTGEKRVLHRRMS